MTIGLALDALVAVLLIATIAYCFVLSRRLGALRDAHAEMRGLVDAFDQAAERAAAGVDALKRAAAETGGDLGREVDKARALADELSLMTGSAEGLAGRLEAGISAKRASVAAGEETESGFRTEGERELFKSLRRAR